jgi:hypothetical protein
MASATPHQARVASHESPCPGGRRGRLVRPDRRRGGRRPRPRDPRFVSDAGAAVSGGTAAAVADTAGARARDGHLAERAGTTLFDFNIGPNATCAGGAIGCERGEQDPGTVALAFAGTHELAADVVQDAAHGDSSFDTRDVGVVTTPVVAAGGLLAGALVGLGRWRRRTA